MAEITAIIPVRAGSTRVPNKNILPFGDSNLLVHKIRQLKQIKLIDRIVVSSDSPAMLAMAQQEGVETQTRPDEYCDEKTKTFNEVVEYVISHLKTDIAIWAPCVCPLVENATFEKAIHAFLNLEPAYDGVVSVRLLKEFIFDEKGPVNFSIEHFVPSQRLPNWHTIVNGFYIAQAQDMVRWKFVYGKAPKLIELSKVEAIDIDDQADFDFAQCMWQKQHAAK